MTQMTLEFEAGLTQRHKSLRECLVARIYAAGLSNVADDLAKAPGNLSREVTCEQLRPDVDWGYLRATCCEQRAA